MSDRADSEATGTPENGAETRDEIGAEIGAETAAEMEAANDATTVPAGGRFAALAAPLGSFSRQGSAALTRLPTALARLPRPATAVGWLLAGAAGVGGIAAVALVVLVAGRGGERPPNAAPPPVASRPVGIPDDARPARAEPAVQRRLSDTRVRLAVGERAPLLGGRLRPRLVEVAGDGRSVLVQLGDDAPATLAGGDGIDVRIGPEACRVVYLGLVGDLADVEARCGPAAAPAGDGPATAGPEYRARAGETVRLAPGVAVTVAMIAPSGGAVRVAIDGAAPVSLEEGQPLPFIAGADSCAISFLGLDPAPTERPVRDAADRLARLAVACNGATGTALAARRGVADGLAPHRGTAARVGETVAFLDGRLEVYVGSRLADGGARLSVAGGVLQPVPAGRALAVEVDGTPCAIGLSGRGAAEGTGVTVTAACEGRVTGPGAIVPRDGDADTARALLLPNRPAALLGERVRLRLSMISPDGEALRLSLNDAPLSTLARGTPADLVVGDGRCSVEFLGREGEGARVRARCDAAAMASRILVAAEQELATVPVGSTRPMLGGKLKLRLSMLAPDGEAVRLAVNEADLRTLERSRPLTLAYGDGLCSVEFLGAREGGAAFRTVCDRAALASNLLVPEAAETVLLAPGAGRKLLSGRASLRLSMVSPDGEALRLSLNGGPLRTVERGRPLAVPTGAGRCELTFLGTESRRAAIRAACDAAALAADPFLPVATETATLSTGRTASLFGGKLTLAASMLSPDGEALRLSVSGAPLATLERGEPMAVTVSEGRCVLTLTPAPDVRVAAGAARAAGVEAACDAGAFARAPFQAAAESADLAHGRPAALFGGRLTLTLSMIAPRGDAIRLDLGNGLRTLEIGEPEEIMVEGAPCTATFAEVVASGAARVAVDCGGAPSRPDGAEEVVLGWGETAQLFGGRLPVRLDMIAPSRSGVRVAVAGGRVTSLERDEPLDVDLGGRPCRLEFLGAEGDRARLVARC